MVMLVGIRGAVKVIRTAGALAVLATGTLLVAAPRPALAAPAESITSYAVRLDVLADGRLSVTETILYDFGGNEKHGILRRIPDRFHYDSDSDRLYPIETVSVTKDGAGEPVDVSSSGNEAVLKIGDPHKTVHGSHTYVIRYTVPGAINGFNDHMELYWNVVGNEWPVPIADASATVTGPAGVQRVTCFAGPRGTSRPCGQSNVDGNTATFHQSRLSPGDSLTAVVAFPVGSIADTGPILVRRRSLASGFQPTPLPVGVGLAIALIGTAVALTIAYRVGRDRYYVGQLPGLTPGPGEPAVQRRKPLFGAPPVSVEFVPPDKVRPGQVGTIVDEKADVVDVTATILDFAVRRHLHITEVRAAGAKKPSDWRLDKLTDGDPKFLPYERNLFRALFADRNSVTLSKLKNTFADDLRKVRRQLYADMVSQGWYRQSPATTRAAAVTLAIVLLLASAGITVLLATTTHLGLIGVGLVVAAVVLLIAAPRFPARTGKGSAALARIQGFRLYVATAEAEQIRFQEREQIFSEYLPYAVVFGLAERWAGIFKDIGTVQPDGGGGLYWYTGPPGWNIGWFAGSVSAFTSTAGSSLSSTPPSASGASGFSGGFSGGGAGGGGGGSW
jgi:hypothetical protein